MKKKYYQEMVVAPEEGDQSTQEEQCHVPEDCDHNPFNKMRALTKGISNIGGLILLELNILFTIAYLALVVGVIEFLTN